jgi:hypothetical protein
MVGRMDYEVIAGASSYTYARKARLQLCAKSKGPQRKKPLCRLYGSRGGARFRDLENIGEWRIGCAAAVPTGRRTRRRIARRRARSQAATAPPVSFSQILLSRPWDVRNSSSSSGPSRPLTARLNDAGECFCAPVETQPVEVVAIGIAAANLQHASAQDIRNRVGDVRSIEIPWSVSSRKLMKAVQATAMGCPN